MPFKPSASRRAALHLILAGLLSACAPGPVRPPPVPVGETPADFQEAHYRRAQALGQPVWRINPQDSLISVTVRRGGTLARLGHDHIIASRNINGFVAPEQGRADFHFRLDQLSVDEPALRTEAGLAPQPSSDAILGTRRNMLSKALDAQRFPFVLIHVTRVAPGAALKAVVTLNGVSRSMDIAAQIEPYGDGIAVSGRMNLLQSDFGIVPFSVLGGAIAISDRLDLRFRILADGRANFENCSACQIK